MEKKIVRLPMQFKDKVVEYYKLFGYELTGESNLLFNRLKLEFSREDSNEKVKNVEYKYALRPFLTFLPLALALFLIVLLTTLFLIFVMSNNGDRLTYFLCFMVPAFAILPLVAIYTYLRYSFDSKNISILSDLNIIKKELGGQ